MKLTFDTTQIISDEKLEARRLPGEEIVLDCPREGEGVLWTDGASRLTAGVGAHFPAIVFRKREPERYELVEVLEPRTEAYQGEFIRYRNGGGGWIRADVTMPVSRMNDTVFRLVKKEGGQ